MSPIGRRSFLGSSLAASAAVGLGGASVAWAADNDHDHDDARPRDAIAGIVETFDTRSAVLLSGGEGGFWLSYYDFIDALIRSPQAARKVDDIVVEWGAGRFEDVARRYTLGEDVPFETVARFVNDCGQPAAWNLPVLLRFLKTLREVNGRLPERDRIRLVAGDPPFEWEKVTTARQYFEQYGSKRDAFLQSRLDESLRSGRKVLGLIGGAHTDKSTPLYRDLNQRHPGALWIVETHFVFFTGCNQAEDRLRKWPLNSIVPVRDTWVGRLPAGSIMPGYEELSAGCGRPGAGAKYRQDGEPYTPFAGTFPSPPGKVRDYIDAYLYLGPGDQLQNSFPYPSDYRDERWWRELERRHLVMFGRPMDPHGDWFDHSDRWWSERAVPPPPPPPAG